MLNKTLITAHSGAENTRNNSMESIYVLAACGAEIVEVDVRLYEGALVMSHDEPACAGACDLLEDCFRAVARHESLRLNIDLKQSGILKQVAELAARCGVESRLLFTGAVGLEDLLEARRRAMPVWFNHDALPTGSDWLRGIEAVGCDTLNVDVRELEDGLLCAGADRLSVWTVDDETQLERLLKAGVRNITTNRPALALKLRGEIQACRCERPIKTVTFNIRGDFRIDGANNFCFRKGRILEKLAQEQPDIIGFQEVMPHVAIWLRESLKDYYVIGCGRGEVLDDEQEAIAFRKDRFNLIEMRTYWLSETPYVPASRYAEQSPCPRVTTEAVLMEYGSGRVLRVINTHLDHEGSLARRLGLKQILTHIDGEKLYPDAPVILMGDFNAYPDALELNAFEEHPGYTNATGGVGVTYHGFGRGQDEDGIDYIWIRGGIRCVGMTKWMDVEDGVYLSDHYPVCVLLAAQ